MTRSQTGRPDIYEVPGPMLSASITQAGPNPWAPDEAERPVAPGSALSRLLSFRTQNVSYTTGVADTKRKTSECTHTG